MEWFESQNPILQAFVATLFTWLLTALGAAVVFFFRDIKRTVLDGMLGFAAGVMIAASFWSLLAPAIEMSEQLGTPGWVPAVIGFLSGGAFLLVVDRLMHKINIPTPAYIADTDGRSWHRSILLVLAITLHNIPEGLAVGVAFGALSHNLPSASLTGAIALAVGIGIQNFPEGTAVSVPLRREGMPAGKSFWWGQLSGVVEPLAGVAGAALVIFVRPLLPYALAFAAGAMIFVAVKELIPESHTENSYNIATIGAMIGFAVMMSLDVALG